MRTPFLIRLLASVPDRWINTAAACGIFYLIGFVNGRSAGLWPW